MCVMRLIIVHLCTVVRGAALCVRARVRAECLIYFTAVSSVISVSSPQPSALILVLGIPTELKFNIKEQDGDEQT